MSNADMRYRPLGQCGMKVSELSLGSWLTYGNEIKDDSIVRKITRRAFDAGVNFFDIADIYAKGGAEEAMGTVLKEFPRHELVVSTKVFWPLSEDINDRGLSRKHIMESIDKSLKRLGMDYVDIYFCHRYDQETPLEETCRAMDDLVHQGKVLYWGTSEWTGAQINEASALCNKKNLYRPQVEQPQYHLLCRKKVEEDVQPAAAENGMGLVTWSPLAYGLLTGKYDGGIPKDGRLAKQEWLKERYYNDETIAKIKTMKTIADGLGCTRAQLALAWVAAQPGVSSVITGATRMEQLEENLGAVKVEITGEVQKQMYELFPPVE